MSNETLKPCPLCPDKTGLRIERVPVKVISPSGDERLLTDYAVTCDACDTIGPPASSFREAEFLWNVRRKP